jgi:hypothetical protein
MSKAPKRASVFGRKRQKPVQMDVSTVAQSIDPKRSRDEALKFLEMFEDSRNHKSAESLPGAR